MHCCWKHLCQFRKHKLIFNLCKISDRSKRPYIWLVLSLIIKLIVILIWKRKWNFIRNVNWTNLKTEVKLPKSLYSPDDSFWKDTKIVLNIAIVIYLSFWFVNSINKTPWFDVLSMSGGEIYLLKQYSKAVHKRVF